VSAGQPSSSGEKSRGQKPVANIINYVATSYHEGMLEEIQQLIEEWEVDLNH